MRQVYLYFVNTNNELGLSTSFEFTSVFSCVYMLQEDQIGVADKNTARTFYAAGVFYDVIQQFKDLLEPEIEVRKPVDLGQGKGDNNGMLKDELCLII